MARIRVLLTLGWVSIFGLSALRCTTEEEPPAVQILSPRTGDVFKLDDTVAIILESDFSRFGGNVSVDYSPDSSKNWHLIESLAKKDGKVRDTINWFPDETGDVVAGSGILIRAYDYDREFVVQTGYITFSN